jgi:excisionase family DNA binding protein
MENKVLIECLRSQAKALRTQAELLDNLVNALESKKEDSPYIAEINQDDSKKVSKLPFSLNADDIAKLLGIGKNKVYNMVHIKDFPKIQIRRKIVIPRDAFLSWLNTYTGGVIPID